MTELFRYVWPRSENFNLGSVCMSIKWKLMVNLHVIDIIHRETHQGHCRILLLIMWHSVNHVAGNRSHIYLNAELQYSSQRSSQVTCKTCTAILYTTCIKQVQNWTQLLLYFRKGAVQTEKFYYLNFRELEHQLWQAHFAWINFHDWFRLVSWISQNLWFLPHENLVTCHSHSSLLYICIPVDVCPFAVHSKVDATNNSNPLFIFIHEDIVITITSSTSYSWVDKHFSTMCTHIL